MSTAAPAKRKATRLKSRARYLENGEQLASTEFLRRYEAQPELQKAQLIEGIVYMPSPIRADVHGEPDGLIHGWLFNYAIQDPEVKFYPNTTLLLDAENAVQPDAILCSAPREWGRVRLDENGYLCGAPELVCEIAASTAAVDLHAKFRAYRRNGIAEYLVWIVTENELRWFALEDQIYSPIKERGGVITSRVFPKLALDVRALLKFNGAKVIAALQKHLKR